MKIFCENVIRFDNFVTYSAFILNCISSITIEFKRSTKECMDEPVEILTEDRCIPTRYSTV